MQIIQTRRSFLAGAAAAGATSVVGTATEAWAEPPPETTTIRVPAVPSACTAPLYMAEELLHEEGFSEVNYVPTTQVSVGLLADGGLDFSMEAPLDYLPLVDDEPPLTVLSGVEVGCMELRANDSIQGIKDLRGKRVGVSEIAGNDHKLVSIMASYVGVDPTTEINWVRDPSISQVDLFKAGKIDAFIGFPPDPGQPCPQGVGHVVVNLAHDYPWSHHFCCMAVANADFMRKNPVATKRTLRALLRATDICHREPERVAQRLVDFGFSQECALMTLKDTRFDVWRDFDPEDTVRFFALRLNELGMIKKTPNEVISEFTDWRYLDGIKRELKG
jgi:NitT/TauT family transport system substrate-binding protein